jgi:DNA-binding IclR family transcriptional regulator
MTQATGATMHVRFPPRENPPRDHNMTTARDRPPEEAAEDTSFARGLRLLLTIADRGEARADELGSLLDMPLSTVYRYLRTLGDFGFVDRHGGGFRLGPRLFIGTGATVSAERLIRHADAALRMLASQTGETAILVRRIGLSSVCLHQIESQEALRVTLEPGTMSPLYAGAPGRVLLAFAPPEVLDEVLAEGLPALTDDTPSEAELRDSLGRIVMTGMAASEGELIAGAAALATPLFREDGIVGAIAVVGPAFRCDEAWRGRTRRLLEEAARTVNAALAEDASR